MGDVRWTARRRSSDVTDVIGLLCPDDFKQGWIVIVMWWCVYIYVNACIMPVLLLQILYRNYKNIYFKDVLGLKMIPKPLQPHEISYLLQGSQYYLM